MVRIASYGPQIDQSHGENRLSHIIKNFIENLPGEFTIIIIWQFWTRDTTKVFVFHINQVYLWALKYLNFLSVQTNHSFYTGVRIKRKRVGFHCISSTTFFAGGPLVKDGPVMFTDYGFYYLNSTNHLF